MFEGDICWRIIHSGRIAYFKQGSKLFSGERLHSATMIRVWPFSVIGVWSILLRSAKAASVGASFQKLTCS